MDGVGGLAVDAVPEFLELLLLEVGVERVLLGLAVVVDVGQLRVAEHAVDQLEDLVGVGLQFGGSAASVAFLLGLVVVRR